MRRRTSRHSLPVILGTALAAVVAAAGVAACGGPDQGASPAAATSASPAAATSTPAPTGGSPAGQAAGSKMAPGLYDLEDGTVVAVGTVEHRDLEGGFWAVVDGSQSAGSEGDVVAVIINGARYARQFSENEGLTFEVYGTRSGEASARMAGPEIVADRVVLAAEGGPAD
jgi:hypothetical protein